LELHGRFLEAVCIWATVGVINLGIRPITLAWRGLWNARGVVISLDPSARCDVSGKNFEKRFWLRERLGAIQTSKTLSERGFEAARTNLVKGVDMTE
jgi:hypothetical protein